MSTSTPGASISYSTDGSAPTPSHPTLTSGDAVIVGNSTLKAMAWKVGQTNSGAASAAYSVTGHLTAPGVSGGGSHTVALRSDGTVFAWGRNAGRELADGTTTMRLQPVATGGVTGATAISVGEGFTLARLHDGRIVGWGANGFSQLGDGTTTNPRPWPVAATGITSAVAVDAGADHALAVLANGTAVGWGRNNAGQIGDGSTTGRPSPTTVTGLTNAVAVSAGSSFSLAVTADGTAWSWGGNGNGQLGTGNTTARSTPGTVPGLTNVRAVAAGTFTSYFLMADGTVRSAGSNAGGAGAGGALGNGTSGGQSTTPVTVSGLTNVVQIAAGSAHGLALKSDRTVWAWGNGGTGQIGNGATSDVTTPVQVAGLPAIVAIGAGATHSLALGLDGSVWAWGANSQGQLGDGSQTTRLVPVQVTMPGTGWTLPPPTLTSLTPTAGPGATSVTLTGTDFGVAQSTSTVSFNGTAATPTAWSPTSITTAVPAGASSGPVTVTVGGRTSSALSFTVASPPTLTALSPTAGPVGASVTITGTNFGASQGASTISFNGAVASPSAWSSTSIVAPVPAGAGSGPVTVTVDGQTSNGLTFTVIPTPTLTALSPTSGASGATVTLTGTNFGAAQGSSVVLFNGTAAVPAAWSASSITTAVPPGASTGPVTVTVQGQVSNAMSFTVIPSPTLTAITPNIGPAGTVVTVTGTNFGSTQGGSTVQFNGTSATPSAWSATSITVPVPTGATSGPVTVNVGGQLSNGLPFVVGQPTTTTVSITDPFPGTTFNAPSSLSISASVVASGPSIDRVEFYDGPLLIGTDTAAPYAVTWLSPLEGPHALTAVAVDQANGTTTSVPVLISIGQAGSTLGTLGTPVITPYGGAFNLPQTISLSAAVGATIHYTLDGSAPSSASPTYTNPFTLADPAAVHAVALQSGWTDSGQAYAYFYIDSVAPMVFTTTPTSSAQNVSIGSPIRVTFNESMAQGSFTASAIELRTAAGILVPSSIWFDDSTLTANVQPTLALALATTYTATVKGGADPNAATDLMGNSVAGPVTWSFTTQATVAPPTVSTTSEVHVRDSTLVTLTAEDRDPQDLPLTYAWTQVAGPTVVLRGGTTAVPSFVTPDTDALLRFRSTVSNGFSTAFAEAEVYVRQFTTAFGVAIAPAEGHTSDVTAAAPTLGHGYIFERLAEALSIPLTSATGRVLQPTSADPLSVSVTGGAGATDVTPLFTYSPSANAVVLNLGAGDALREAIGEGRAELAISSPDSAGDYVHISVPIVRAVARINGTTQVVQGTGSTEGGSVHLSDAAGAYRASATVDANGTFAIEDVPAGSYELSLDAPDGVSGWVNVTVPSNPLSAILAVSIDARATAGLEPRQWPCDPIFPGTYEGRPTSCTEEGIHIVPRGTAILSMPIVATQPNNAAYGFAAGERCQGLASWGYAYNHGTSSVRLYLDGQLMANRTMSNCDMTSDAFQILSEQTLNVATMARERNLVLRIVRSWTVDTSPFLEAHHPTTNIPGGLWVAADWQPTPKLAITSITDRVGSADLKLHEETAGKVLDKLLGVPFDNCGTFQGAVVPGQASCGSTPSPGEHDHRWRLRVNYAPANSQITAVRAFVVGPGLQEPLAFEQGTATNGELDLTNVRFPEFQPHVLWHAKFNRLSIVVEIDGIAPDRPAATVSGELGIGTDHGPWLLTALYDAARIPGAGSRRFGPLDRDETRGGDAWGRERTFAFLQANADLWFNDLSLEHGGSFEPDHGGHKTGLEIDVRYFGSGGNNNLLNGQAGDRDLGTFRLGVLTNAQNGDINAQRSIVAWIRQNRQRMNEIASDPAVRQVLIGIAPWNQRSLRQGMYPNGTQQILDPDLPANEAWIGTWSPAKVRNTGLHLSHVHIDLERKP